jgi:transcriptional antiterminator NusG
MSWYTIQTASNCETKVINEIKNIIKLNNIDYVREIFSPEETLIEFKGGQKKEKKRRLYSNYVFIEMDYNDILWHLFGKIKGFIGFIGSKNNPAIISEKEIANIKGIINSGEIKHKVMFELNSKVRITKGSFSDFIGMIKSVDYKKNKAKVVVTVFNRETEVEVELDALQVGGE